MSPPLWSLHIIYIAQSLININGTNYPSFGFPYPDLTCIQYTRPASASDTSCPNLHRPFGKIDGAMAYGHVLSELDVLRPGTSVNVDFAPKPTGYRTATKTYGRSMEGNLPRNGKRYGKFINPFPFYRTLIFIWAWDESLQLCNPVCISYIFQLPSWLWDGSGMHLIKVYNASIFASW